MAMLAITFSKKEEEFLDAIVKCGQAKSRVDAVLHLLWSFYEKETGLRAPVTE